MTENIIERLAESLVRVIGAQGQPFVLDFWWERHAKHRNSGFEYLIPRLDKFRSMKARNLTPEMIQDFLDNLLKTLAPASGNHYRTIFNSAFNFARKWKKYDDNPVAPISQFPEREPRDRFVTVAELADLIGQCRQENDLELLGFVTLAACTGMRRGEIMPRKWSEVRVDDKYPYIYVAKTKNKRPKRLPLPGLAILQATRRTNTCSRQSRTSSTRETSRSRTHGT